ncbi:MAG: Choline-sulfatase [Anaerolineales bacterium]|nr:Choline-sulfatase [Anaerolineales bacterium]
MAHLSRRDILKLAALASGGAAWTALRSRGGSAMQEQKPNIVVLVADTMSAANLSLYGYERQTTPNLERLADRAIVYHSHYAGGNFTSPGTATLLTGSFAWTHRTVNLGGLVRRSLAGQNIFHLLGPAYHRSGFAQNIWADLLLRQFGDALDWHIPAPTFMDGWGKRIVSHSFAKDSIGAYYAIDDFLISTHPVVNPLAGSPSFGYISLLYNLSHTDVGAPDADHPYGLPTNGYYYFQNRVVYDGVRDSILDLHGRHSPFFAYFHLMSPHALYCPTRKFVDSLANVELPTKQMHPLGERINRRTLLENRKNYDEFVANVDAEMGRLFDSLEQAGVLEDTYFIITSDHGEMFERGVFGHATPLLYEPIIHVPLLVIPPGPVQRLDIRTPTSNADLLPTILSLAKMPIPSGLDGRILPGLGGEEDPERPVISVEAKEASSFQPLARVSLSMIKGTKKLTAYMGYNKSPEAFELYDLHEDPDEKRDLFLQDTVTAAHMKEELLDLFTQAERPFQPTP